MPAQNVLAAVAVADVDAAATWYERFLGRAADARPMASLADWQFPGGGVLQLVADPERAGRSLLTLVVDDLTETVAALEARGVDLGAIDDTTSDKVLFLTLTDPEGNTITVVEQR